MQDFNYLNKSKVVKKVCDLYTWARILAVQCKDVVRRLTTQSRRHENLAKDVCYRWPESVLDCRGSEASNIRSRKSKLLWGRQRNKRDRKTLESAGCRVKCCCSFVVEGRNVKEQQALEPLASCHPFLWLGRG